MQFREMGKTGIMVSVLGFGAMRMPTLEGSDKVNVEAAVNMIRGSIDGGINYLDTANPYNDMPRLLDEQLANLEIDCIDFYLLYSLTSDYVESKIKLDYKFFLLDARDAGKIKYMGLSFHDNLELFKEIVDDFEWDFCQIQLNFMNEENHRTLRKGRVI